MESNSDPTVNPRKRDSTVLSSGNAPASTSHKKQKSVPLSAIIAQHEQPTVATLDQINEPLNEMEERSIVTFTDDYLTQSENLIALIRKLQFENEVLKGKQAMIDDKDRLLELYKDLNNELRDKCAKKDKQLVENGKHLTEKNKHLSDNARLIELLEEKCAKNENHLQSSKINELQEECNKKDKLLVDKANLIEELRAQNSGMNVQLQSKTDEINVLQENCDEKSKELIKKDKLLADNKNLIEELRAENCEQNIQLQSKLNEISKLQATCKSKDSQLNETKKLVGKLQKDCAKKDTKMTATLDRLKKLKKCMQDSSKLVDALCNCGISFRNQSHYTEALVHYDNAIDFEKATQNRPGKLAQLFTNKSGFHVNLKQYQQAIDTANLALQHDSNNKYALNNRAAAYENLKQYLNARRDLEKALQLDQCYTIACNSLKRVQKRIDALNSQ